MKSKSRLLAALLVLAAFGAKAQNQLPGLWEHTFKMGSQGGEMEKAQAQMQAQLAAMPPDKRKQVEAMMKSRGMSMGANSTSMKFCLTKEQAAKPPEARMPGDCKQTDVKRSGSSMSYKFACTTPQQVSGEGQMSFVNDKAYTGKSTTIAQVDGQARQMSMEMSGQWLGADCGDVKPLGAVAGK